MRAERVRARGVEYTIRHPYRYPIIGILAAAAAGIAVSLSMVIAVLNTGVSR